MPNLPIGRKPKAPRRAAPAAVLAAAETAFAEEYRALYKKARRFAIAYVGTLWADDVVQEAYVSMWEACYRDGDLPTESAEKLLFRILRRRIGDLLRDEDILTLRHTSPGHVLDLTERIVNQTETARVADGHLLAGRITYILSTFPPVMRRAYELSQQHVRDPGAIAQALGITKSTARWHVWEATRRLRAALIKDGYIAETDEWHSGEPQ